jgi:tetratricopeptide (TPR) repeat protein
MADPGVKLFISCVSGEFGVYREPLRNALALPDIDVKVQEDFKPQGKDTLSMLVDYIEPCAAVVHFVGDMSGAAPPDFCVQELLERYPNLKARLPPLAEAIQRQEPISYTQWEAWLALFLRKTILIVIPSEKAARGPKFAPTAEMRKAQDDHLKRLKTIDRFPGDRFVNEDGLTIQILQSAVIPALKRAAREGVAAARQPRNLPFVSLGDLFKGRKKELDALGLALAAAKGAGVLVRALHGLGGIGKSRLAVEYAWKHEADYSALLFVRAESAAALTANLAALAGAEVIDLPEAEAPEDGPKIVAVLNWLEANPTWLLILDNVDDGEAVAAVTKLMPRLKGGHVIVTARAANFPAGVRKLELDALDEGPATDFLLERTRDDRAKAPDDEPKARELARELGGLALGLEQAAAQIATDRIGFGRYLNLWNDNRDKALSWSDPLTGSERTLATTWATSVARLSLASRDLLDRLAMLAPDPIPDSLLEVAVPGASGDEDAQSARAGLYAYSLISRARGEDGAAPGLAVHRLVQDFARRAMTSERRAEALHEAVEWVDAAVPIASDDVRTWPVLNPLAPHALAVARRADDAGIAEPTARLFNALAILSSAKARYAEAEPLYRRVVEINEFARGGSDPIVATCLNNLALLLKTTNRLREAEPLYRRALKIDEASFGPDHPNVATDLGNLAGLLQGANRLAEAEPLTRRALAIDEASYGPDHPNVAIRLNNLAELLRHTNRLGEAEPLYRRALAIWEKGLGAEHPRLATGLNNLALLLKDTNRPAGAEPLYRRALKIDEASFGRDHPEVATDLNNLASLLEATNHLAEAEPLYRRALAIDEASFGPNHPNVARDLNNLAGLLKKTNRVAEAEPLFRWALAIFDTSLGPNHPSTVTVRNNLAGLLANRRFKTGVVAPKRSFFSRLFGKRR